MADPLRDLTPEERIELVKYALAGKMSSLPDDELDTFVGELCAFLAQRNPAAFAQAMQQVVDAREG